MTKPFPSHAKTVIIGGGIIGCSIAYHLTKLGWKDIVVLERGTMTCGTTWHAAGLIMQMRANYTMTQLSCYGAQLYSELEAETGQATGFKRNGSMPIARTKERFTEIKRTASLAKCFGVDAEILSASEVKKMWPLLDESQICGGVFVPGDGQTNPIDTTMALAKGARMGGAKIIEGVTVTDILTEQGQVRGVETDHGRIDCEYVVNCAGIWAREIGKMAGVNVPIYAAEHMYVTTQHETKIASNLPVLRDTDGYIYAKEDAGKLVIGSFEPLGKALPMHKLPANQTFIELTENWDQFELPMTKAIEMIPSLENAGIRHFMNGPESFTPDNKFVIGEAPELRNFYVAAGFNSQGILSAAGVGKAIAEWMVEGTPTMDLSEVDIARFHGFQNNERYLRNRIGESLGLLYAMHWPFKQVETARPVRTVPVHEKLKAANAYFGETAGWERPNWYAPHGEEPVQNYSYNKQNWFPHVAAEHKATREGLALFELSSFAKILVQGKDACAQLQRIAANNVDVEIGKIVYTQFLNKRGGIEADLTIARYSETEFMVVTAAASQTREYNWLKRNIEKDAEVTLTDVTSGYSVFSIMGPHARAFMSKVSSADFSNEAFPFGTQKEVEIGYTKSRAYRLTYVGELGWEIYVSSEFAPSLFDYLMKEGAEFDITLAGYYALDSLRSEKAYRHWGHDITPADTPLEAGLGFAVDFKKDVDFIGRSALLKQKEAGLKKRMVLFKLKDPEAMLYHDEPIYRNGELVGRLTSASYGHSLGSAIGMGYIESDEIIDIKFIKSGVYEIEIAGEKFEADATTRPFYDPKSLRVKG